jgi:group I intron endonuclease
VAGNSLGYKHSSESIEKIRNSSLGRKHSMEVRKAMSENRKGINNNFFGKSHTQNVKDQLRNIALNRTKQPKPGFEVEVKDIETNTIVVYNSIREAARKIGTTISVLHRRDKLGIVKPYRNRYYINIKRN